MKRSIYYSSKFCIDIKNFENNEENILKIYILHKNDIDYASKILVKYDKVKLYMCLSDLNIGTIPISILKLTNIEELYIYNNDKLLLPDSIDKLVNLKILHIDYFSKNICGLKNLETLTIFRTFPKKIPFEITKLPLKTFIVDKIENNLYDLQNLDFKNNFGNLIDGLYRTQIKKDINEIEKKYKYKRFIFRLSFITYKSKKIFNYKVFLNLIKY